MREKLLSRYELGGIQRLHDERHYREASEEYVARQMEKIGLKPSASRFEVAERIRELERKLDEFLWG